jgi:phage head maturation protease
MNKTLKTSLHGFHSKLLNDLGPRDIVAKISTTAVDREGDVIEPAGVDLKDYWKNPTVLLQHDGQSRPIGVVKRGDIQRQSDGLVARFSMLERAPSLPSNLEWPPDTILDLFKMGAPLAFSVGFRVKDGGIRAATKSDRKKYGRDVQRVVTAWELMEFSVVSIPANQDALLVAVGKSAQPAGMFTLGALGLQQGARVTVIRKAPRLNIPAGSSRLRI